MALPALLHRVQAPLPVLRPAAAATNQRAGVGAGGVMRGSLALQELRHGSRKASAAVSAVMCQLAESSGGGERA